MSSPGMDTEMPKRAISPLLTSLCVLLLGSASLSASAQVVYGSRPAPKSDGTVYTWIDAKGVRHYVDASLASPTEFAKSKARDVRLSIPADQRRANMGQPQDSQPSPQSTDEMTASWEDGANPGEKLAPTRAAACEVAKRNVAVLSDQSQPAYVRDASGQPVQLDDQGRADRLAQAMSDQQAYCG